MKRKLFSLAMGLGFAWASQAGAQEQPFVLVNIIDLFDMFDQEFTVDQDFNYQSEAPPNQAEANRVGTNPASLATDGTRAWIGGYYGGVNYDVNNEDNARLSWYASIGIAELPNIFDATSFPLNFVPYEGTFQRGPGVGNTDQFVTLSYDAANDRLFATFDENTSFSPPITFPFSGATQEDTYLAEIDINPASPTYGEFLFKVTEPISGQARVTGGARVDPLDPSALTLLTSGSGRIWFFDPDAPAPATDNVIIFDPSQLSCIGSAYRNQNFNPITGDLYIHNKNAVQRVPRDVNTSAVPFAGSPRELVELGTDNGGNGVVDTTAEGDDVQLVAPGTSGITASTPIIGKGPNGLIDTVAAGDDVGSAQIATDFLQGVGPPENCDPNGFTFTSQAQGVAVASIPSDNLAELEEDLVLASSRPTFGAGQASTLRFIDSNGEPYDELLLPCVPESIGGLGIAFYDITYHAPTGTLLVLEYERRRLYVYRAQTLGGPQLFRYDHDRDGDVDLVDYWQFQRCFTGPEGENVDGNFNCQYFIYDEDCDVDLDDANAMMEVLATSGPTLGDGILPPGTPQVRAPVEAGDTSVSVGSVGPNVFNVTVRANGASIGDINSAGLTGIVAVAVAPALTKFDQITAIQTNSNGTSPASAPVEVGDGNGPVLVSLGIRESGDTGPIGSNGTSTGDFEIIGASTNGSGGAPQGKLLLPLNAWQTVTFDPNTDPIEPFFDLGDGLITETRGILESLEVAVDAGSAARSSGTYTLYVDNVVNVGTGTAGSDAVLADFEGFATGDEVLFQEPTFSGSTSGNLVAGVSVSEVTDQQSNGGVQSLAIQWFFRDTTEQRWVRVTSFAANNTALPIIDLTKPVRMDLLLEVTP